MESLWLLAWNLPLLGKGLPHFFHLSPKWRIEANHTWHYDKQFHQLKHWHVIVRKVQRNHFMECYKTKSDLFPSTPKLHHSYHGVITDFSLATLIHFLLFWLTQRYKLLIQQKLCFEVFRWYFEAMFHHAKHTVSDVSVRSPR